MMQERIEILTAIWKLEQKTIKLQQRTSNSLRLNGKTYSDKIRREVLIGSPNLRRKTLHSSKRPEGEASRQRSSTFCGDELHQKSETKELKQNSHNAQLIQIQSLSPHIKGANSDISPHLNRTGINTPKSRFCQESEAEKSTENRARPSTSIEKQETLTDNPKNTNIGGLVFNAVHRERSAGSRGGSRGNSVENSPQNRSSVLHSPGAKMLAQKLENIVQGSPSRTPESNYLKFLQPNQRHLENTVTSKELKDMVAKKMQGTRDTNELMMYSSPQLLAGETSHKVEKSVTIEAPMQQIKKKLGNLSIPKSNLASASGQSQGLPEGGQAIIVVERFSRATCHSAMIKPKPVVEDSPLIREPAKSNVLDNVEERKSGTNRRYGRSSSMKPVVTMRRLATLDDVTFKKSGDNALGRDPRQDGAGKTNVLGYSLLPPIASNTKNSPNIKQSPLRQSPKRSPDSPTKQSPSKTNSRKSSINNNSPPT